jgi:hypothetical protein
VSTSPAAAEAGVVGMRLRLDAFLRATAVTAHAALQLAESGDPEAAHLLTEATALLEQTRALLDDDPDRARELLQQAETVMTELAVYVLARQRELWPELAAEAEREDAERFDRLVDGAPPRVAARLQARRDLIAAATRRHDLSAVPLVPVLLGRARAAAREGRPRRRDAQRTTGERSPPRRSSDPDDADPPDVAPPAGEPA